jgi:hypothetical protein
VKQSGRNGSSANRSSANGPRYGSTRPRLASPSWGRRSYGAEVAEVAAAFGIELLPWQELAAQRLLEHGPDGRRRYRTALVSVARQNGKTYWLRAVVLWWLTVHADRLESPQSVVHAANTRGLASDVWSGVVRLLEEKRPDLVADVKRGAGRERLTLSNGSTYEPLAASDAWHGRSVDLAIVDEVWAIKSSVLDDGILPTTMARPDPLVLMASTAGDESSVAMRGWRDRGLASIDAARKSAHLLLEWSAPEDADPQSSSSWAMANPGMGRTIRRDALSEASTMPRREAFYRAHLNRWVVSSVGTWLPDGTWSTLAAEVDLEAEADPSRGPVLAVELDRTSGEYALVTATPLEGGRVHIGSRPLPDEASLWRELETPILAGTTVLLPPLFEERAPFVWHGENVSTVGDRELRTWAALAEQAILGGLVVHDGSELLGDQVARTIARTTHNGTTLVGVSKQSVHSVRALVWALTEATKIDRAVPRAVVRFA